MYDPGSLRPTCQKREVGKSPAVSLNDPCSLPPSLHHMTVPTPLNREARTCDVPHPPSQYSAGTGEEVRGGREGTGEDCVTETTVTENLKHE